MKKLMILLVALVLLFEFAPPVDARGGRGRGRGRGRGHFGRGGRDGGTAPKSETRVQELRNKALDRAARLSLGRSV